MRGIRLQSGDEVISLSVLRHVDRGVAVPDEEDVPESEVVETEVVDEPVEGAPDEIMLTVTDLGFGKRTLARHYRVTGRGGQGIANINLTPRTGASVVASFPVRPGDDVMLVTDEGRLIRVPSDQVRVTGRASMGVTVFRLGDTERVTSVFPVLDDGEADAEPVATGEPDAV